MRRFHSAAGVRSRPPDVAITTIPPPSRPRPVRRARLMRTFASVAPEVPLVLLVAPPGYGKTTALQQWAAEDDRRFGWAHLEEADNDPLRLLRHIALALHQIHPLDDAVWRALELPDVSPLGLIVPRLAASLAAHGEPWVLVLDDFHVLRGSIGLDVIIALAEDLPPGCHIVVASRHKPGLRLGRMRAQGRCVQFGREEMSFTRDETREVLGGAGLDLSEDVPTTLQRRTEGWPAGLYLIALAVRAGLDPAAAGTEATIVDYLREEVLAGESPETVRLLRRTAALDELSGPLCDAVLGRTGSTAWLAEIENRNLFVVPLDRNRQSYRYHRLFKETLLAELRRLEPGEEARVHQRAAAWYAEHGRPEQAISHALDAGDPATAARLVSGALPGYLNTGRLDPVRGWLEALSDGALDRYPGLAADAGWVWALSGDGVRAHRCLLAAETGARMFPVPAGRSPASSIASLRTALAPLGVERMLIDAQRAYALEAVGSSCYPLASLLRGVAHLLTGAADRAAKDWEQAAHFGRDGHPAVASFALGQLALLAAERDDWLSASDYAAEACALVDSATLSGSLTSVLPHAARARVALHAHDTAAAWRHLDEAQRLYTWPSAAAFPWLAAQAGIVLGRLLLDLDDHAAAELKAADARRQLARLATEGVLRAQYRQFAAELSRGGQPVVPSQMAPTAAELRILQLLPTHLTLSEIADELFISRNTVKSQVASIYRKLRSSTRTEAVREGRNLGLIES